MRTNIKKNKTDIKTIKIKFPPQTNSECCAIDISIYLNIDKINNKDDRRQINEEHIHETNEKADSPYFPGIDDESSRL